MQIKSKEGTTTIVWDVAAHGIGNIQRATSPDGITNVFAYDNVSRLSSAQTGADGLSFDFNYGYDSVGRPATIEYPSVNGHSSPRFAVSFDYTSYGAIRAVNDISSGLPLEIWRAKEANAFDEITSETFANGVTLTTRQFDVRGRLSSLTTISDQDKTLQNLGYEYDPNENLTTRTDRMANIVERYTYDPLDRLRLWDVRTSDKRRLSQQFDYDDIGNLKARTTLFGNGTNLVYHYSGVHAGPHAVTSINKSIYTYDTAGRERKAPGRNSTYMSWGVPSRIVGTRLTDRFKYDFEQSRILKARSDGTRIVTLGQLFERIIEPNGSSTNTYYVPGPGGVVAVSAQRGNVEPFKLYLHDDRIGSVVGVTKDHAGIPEMRSYDPFGTTRQARDPSRPTSGFSSVKLGFTERETDSEIGLVNMLGRLYDANVGRFVSPDPIVGDPYSSQSYNRYSYVNNNPLRWTDPTGLQFEEILSFLLEGVEKGTYYSVAPCTWCMEEWEPWLPPLSEPPLLTGLESPPTGPPLVPAGVSDDTGLTPPPLVNAEEEGPSFRAPRPEGDLRRMLHFNLPPEQIGQALPYAQLLFPVQIASYGVLKNFKDEFVDLWKFVTNHPDPVFAGKSGLIYETPEKLGFGAQKAIFDLGMLFLPTGAGEKAAVEGATTFLHGAPLVDAEAVVRGLLLSTHTKGLPIGSFFTHEASQPNALIAASNWPIVQGKVLKGGQVGIVEMTVPNEVLSALREQGLVVNRTIGFLPEETAFLPQALQVLNEYAIFRIIAPVF